MTLAKPEVTKLTSKHEQEVRKIGRNKIIKQGGGVH